MKGNPIQMGGMATKAVAKMKEPMKMKSPVEMKSPMEQDAIGPKGSATIPAHIREVYPNLTNEAYNKDKSFYDKAAQAVIKSKKSPTTMKSPAELESPAKDYSTEKGSHGHPHGGPEGPKGGPMMKSPMEAEHGDSPAELESPTKKIKYFGQNTSGSEVTEVMNHNKKYHTDPKREGNKLSNEVVKPGHPDH